MSCHKSNDHGEDEEQYSSQGSFHGICKKKQTVPSFLIKTYQILEVIAFKRYLRGKNPEVSDILSWSEDGQSFVVKNQSELAGNLLNKYFKHKNYPSFLRQLNMYNFKKTKTEKGESKFEHKWFRRGGKFQKEI